MANKACSKCGQEIIPNKFLECGWKHALDTDGDKMWKAGCQGIAVPIGDRDE